MTKIAKPRLGKGLSALIGTPAPINANTTQPHTEQVAHRVPDDARPLPGSELGFKRIPVAAIAPNPYQPRQAIDEASLKELAASIKAAGVMQPIAVRLSPASAEGRGGGAGGGLRYQLIAGERRWRAAQLAGLTELPAVVTDANDQTTAEWALIENVQRQDLNPIDRAQAFRNLSIRFGLSQGAIAERVGIDRSTVSNTIRLLELEPEIQEMIAGGALSTGHAKVLLSAAPGKARAGLAKRVADESWSVRRLEQHLASSAGVPAPAGGPTPGTGPSAADLADARAALALAQSDAQLRDLEKQLSQHLGTKVRLKTDSSRTRGRLVVHFYDLAHFDGLLARLGFRAES
ncbi:MAG: ParB/RepB/Spo0J family partition protein [Phycisphaerales bacterium]|nr:ParB/RepB/Spo0J family partition protein [Phycisphaerales bacterium]